MSGAATILPGDVFDVLPTLDTESVHCCVTSPPYWALRDYGVEGQLGLEDSPEAYVERMVAVFREVRRVLRADGTLWLNIGDSYAGGGNGGGGSFAQDGIRCALPGTDKHKATRHGNRGASNGIKPKDLVGIPWLLAFALRADGWYLRSDIIWSKPNPMPESVTDRPTKAHEYLFLLSKSAIYYYDAEAIREKSSTKVLSRPVGWADEGEHTAVAWMKEREGKDLPETQANLGKFRDKQRGHGRRHAGFNDRWDLMEKQEQQANGRNKRNVWEIATHPYPEAHFATFPPDLVKPCILSGTSEHGVCSMCGAPWERIVKRVVGTSKPCPKTDTSHHARGGHGLPIGTVGKSGSGRTDGYSETLGWQPSCTCGGETTPATVIDPFCGSGTTGQVAIHYGRRFIGVELNPSYVDLARKRIAPFLDQQRLTL